MTLVCVGEKERIEHPMITILSWMYVQVCMALHAQGKKAITQQTLVFKIITLHVLLCVGEKERIKYPMITIPSWMHVQVCMALHAQGKRRLLNRPLSYLRTLVPKLRLLCVGEEGRAKWASIS